MFPKTINPSKGEAHIEGLLLEGEKGEGIKLFANTPMTIKHGLGRIQRGWLITDINNESIIFRKRPFNAEVLVLESSTNTTVKIWVY